MLSYPDGAIFELRQSRRRERPPSQLLQDLLEIEPRAEPEETAELLRDAFGLTQGPREAVLRWFDRRDPAELDAALGGILGRASDEPASLHGAVLGDGRFQVTECVAGSEEAGLFAGEERSTRRAVLLTVGVPQIASLERVRKSLDTRVRHAPSIAWIGPYAPGHVLVESVPGPSLRAAWRTARPPAEVASVLKKLAEHAQAAHASGTTLQGARPETMGLDERGDLWLTARPEWFLSGMVRRDPAPPVFQLTYRAPEAFDLAAGTPASDVFTLALLVAEWLSGAHPFDAATTAKHFMAMMSGRPTSCPPEVPKSALSLDPRMRPGLESFVSEVLAKL